MRVPIEVAKRVFSVESLAADTPPLDIALSLVLLDTQALNVEPLGALVLTLDHYRIFVRHPVSANAILLRVVNLNQFRWHLSRKNSLGSLYVFLVTSRQFLRRARHSRIPIFLVRVVSFPFLLSFQSERVLRYEGHILVRIKSVLFPFAFLTCLFTAFLLPLVLLLFFYFQKL